MSRTVRGEKLSVRLEQTACEMGMSLALKSIEFLTAQELLSGFWLRQEGEFNRRNYNREMFLKVSGHEYG